MTDKPATPLPWELEWPIDEHQPWIVEGPTPDKWRCIGVVTCDFEDGNQGPYDVKPAECDRNAKYIIHACNTYPELQAEVERLREQLTAKDDPQWDATDAAHPAWWRGQDYGVQVLCQKINEILDGSGIGGVSNEPWESTRKRLAELAERDKPCVWRWDDSVSEWYSSCCNHYHVARARCCPDCGHPIKEQKDAE